MRSEAWRPAAAARNRSPREARDPALQALRPGCEELAARIRRQLPAVVGRRAPKETEARPREPKTATVERREASVPRHGTQGASQAPRKRLACRVMCRPNGCLARTRTSLGAPLTLDSGWRSKVARPGRRHAPRERDGLFDIVRWDYRERFSAEPQVGTRLSVLILRSARAGAVPQNRTRVRASRRMRTATMRDAHASRRIAAR